MEFLDFGILDIIDILLVAILFYQLYKLIKGSAAVKIFIGIAVIIVLWKLVGVLHLESLNNILENFINAGVIAIIVVFRQEIRKFLLVLGTTNISKRNYFFLKQFKWKEEDDKMRLKDIDTLVNSCESLSNSSTGALIVIQRNTNLDFICETGDNVEIKLSQPIIESIFFKNSPLHDGATVIKDGVIIATRVILPISNTTSISSKLGLRHRAALGITEKTDAVCLIVSEETGKLSYSKEGNLFYDREVQDLRFYLKRDLN